MQVTPHVYVMHIDDGNVGHPGGSNNYFVGEPSGDMVLIDTGEQQREWTRCLLDYYDQLGRPRLSAILLTHSHADHIGGVDRVQEVTRAPVRCHPKLVARLEAMVGKGVVKPLRSREALKIGGAATLRVLFTPGHEADHVCFYLKEDRVLFTGDCVLGASPSSVRDLKRYMHSLQLLTRCPHETICPGHGPVVPPPRGAKLVRWYIQHREQRELQVLAALARGLTEVNTIAQAVYPRNLPRGLRPRAERNVATHLEKLRQEGRVVVTPSRYALAPD